ncbi:MAG: hypothetical protein ACRDNW_06475 [Trebonia sp.]
MRGIASGRACRTDRGGSRLARRSSVIDKVNGMPGPLHGLLAPDFGHYAALELCSAGPPSAWP